MRDPAYKIAGFLTLLVSFDKIINLKNNHSLTNF
jgi:hypothetical protein